MQSSGDGNPSYSMSREERDEKDLVNWNEVA